MVSIKKAGIDAVPVIHALAKDIWPIAYKDVISADQIEFMLELMYSEKSLLDQMQKHDHQFILAIDDEKVLGYASYSPKIMNNIASEKVYRLHKLYVSIPSHYKGVGRALVDHIINEIKPLGATQLELNVNRKNNAVSFYQKLGFIILREELLDLGQDYYMDDYIMTVDL
ncbi:MAG: GNAT family N-acetyltransferase [Bacteroidota bacterium]